MATHQAARIPVLNGPAGWSVILPPFLVKAARKRFPTASYTAPCNNTVLNLVIVCGAVVYLTVVLDVFGLLPTFR